MSAKQIQETAINDWWRTYTTAVNEASIGPARRGVRLVSVARKVSKQLGYVPCYLREYLPHTFGNNNI